MLVYSEPKPAKGYFYFPSNKDNNIYLDIGIAPLEPQQMGIILEQKVKKIKDFPEFSPNELYDIY